MAHDSKEQFLNLPIKFSPSSCIRKIVSDQERDVRAQEVDKAAPRSAISMQARPRGPLAWALPATLTDPGVLTGAGGWGAGLGPFPHSAVTIDHHHPLMFLVQIITLMIARW